MRRLFTIMSYVFGILAGANLRFSGLKAALFLILSAISLFCAIKSKEIRL